MPPSTALSTWSRISSLILLIGVRVGTMLAARAHFAAVVELTPYRAAAWIIRRAALDGFQHLLPHLVADLPFGGGALISDTSSFRNSDGARQTDTATHSGLATRHAALDGFQNLVADIVAEFVYAFGPATGERRRFIARRVSFRRSDDFIGDTHCCIR